MTGPQEIAGNPDNSSNTTTYQNPTPENVRALESVILGGLGVAQSDPPTEAPTRVPTGDPTTARPSAPSIVSCAGPSSIPSIVQSLPPSSSPMPGGSRFGVDIIEAKTKPSARRLDEAVTVPDGG